jgi:quercetin dioxygenase-like cupin family protein
MRSVSFALAAVVVAAVPSAAQDPVKVAPSSYHVIAENERVRVLHTSMPPGGKAAMHEHPAHVAVSLNDGTVRMTTGDGQNSDVGMKTGEVLLMPPGTHATANAGAAPIEVIVIELKAAPGAAALPGTRPGMKSTVVLDDPRVRAVRVSFEPSFREPAGSTHDYDQVVVMLAPGDVSLTMDGKTASSWKKGDVRLIGRGVAHETAAGKMAGDAIIVAIR